MQERGVNIMDAMLITRELVGEVINMKLEEDEKRKIEVAAQLLSKGAVYVLLDSRVPVSSSASENVTFAVKPDDDKELEKYIELAINSEAGYLMTSGDDREAYLNRMKGVMIGISDTYEQLSTRGEFVSFKDWLMNKK